MKLDICQQLEFLLLVGAFEDIAKTKKVSFADKLFFVVSKQYGEILVALIGHGCDSVWGHSIPLVGKSPIFLRADLQLCDWLVTLTYSMAFA